MKTWYYPYRITLEAGAALTEFGGNPNTIGTMHHVPGSSMRGVAAAAFRDPVQGDKQWDIFHTLVLGGNVRYLNAYPLLMGCRALPTPVAYRKSKRDRIDALLATPCFDLSACSPEDDLKEDLEPLAEPFVTYTAPEKRLLALETTGKVHHQRDRAKGRAWTDAEEHTHGALFSMEALAGDQQLEGLVAIRGADEGECDRLFDRVKPCFQQTVLIGRSRRAGYGGCCKLEWLPKRDRELHGANLLTGDIPANGRFGILLTSAYIGRHPETGHHDPTYFIREMLEKFEGKVVCTKECRAFSTAGGFNRKWKLETPQVPVLAAGSMFICTAKEALPFQTLLAVENEGLGERKTEGFGRFAFVTAPEKKLVLQGGPEESVGQEPQGEIPALVSQAEKRILARAVGQRVVELAAMLSSDASKIPSGSLLGRLRGVLRNNDAKSLDTLREWLGDGDNALRRTAMDQLEKCRIRLGNRQWRLRDFLQDCLRDAWPGDIARTLNLEVIAQCHHLTTKARAEAVLNELRQATVLQFLDGLLASLAVKNRREGADS